MAAKRLLMHYRDRYLKRKFVAGDRSWGEVKLLEKAYEFNTIFSDPLNTQVNYTYEYTPTGRLGIRMKKERFGTAPVSNAYMDLILKDVINNSRSYNMCKEENQREAMSQAYKEGFENANYLVRNQMLELRLLKEAELKTKKETQEYRMSTIVSHMEDFCSRFHEIHELENDINAIDIRFPKDKKKQVKECDDQDDSED